MPTRVAQLLVVALPMLLVLALLGPDFAEAGSDPRMLSISDTKVPEGDAGTVKAVFRVSLSRRAANRVKVRFKTLDGTRRQEATTGLSAAG